MARMTPSTSHNLLHLVHTHTQHRKLVWFPSELRKLRLTELNTPPSGSAGGQRQASNAAPHTANAHMLYVLGIRTHLLNQESQVTSCPRGEGWTHEGRRRDHFLASILRRHSPEKALGKTPKNSFVFKTLTRRETVH